jgi:F-type H+-transporting ATPase subunit b|tara:strand:+ start:14815 stop:15303 length:489 start_codon:yes stop_codon:yes gene_type:complete
MDATFWVAISFVLFVAFLIYKKIPGVVAKSLDDKIKEITQKIEEAENLKKESDKLLSKYQIQLDESKKECEEILLRATKLNEEESASMEEKIHSMLAVKEKNIKEKIIQAKDNALKEVKKISTIIAVESAKKIISQTIEKSTIESVNYSSIKENLENLKKYI